MKLVNFSKLLIPTKMKLSMILNGPPSINISFKNFNNLMKTQTLLSIRMKPAMLFKIPINSPILQLNWKNPKKLRNFSIILITIISICITMSFSSDLITHGKLAQMVSYYLPLPSNVPYNRLLWELLSYLVKVKEDFTKLLSSYGMVITKPNTMESMSYNSGNWLVFTNISQPMKLESKEKSLNN